MITEKQEKELIAIMEVRVSVVNRCEELGGFLSKKYLAELDKVTKRSEDFHKKIQLPAMIISETPYDYSQEKVFHELSLKRLAKEGIHQ